MPFKSKKRVIIVEDDKELLDTYAEILREEGYDVVCASNGDEALKIMEPCKKAKPFGKAFDLCILDLMIPGKTGDVITDILKYEQVCLTPILVISGMPRETLKPYAGKLRAVQGFLPKPINLDEFLSAVKIMSLGYLSDKPAATQVA